MQLVSRAMIGDAEADGILEIVEEWLSGAATAV